MERDEQCPECQTSAIRQFTPRRIHLAKTSVQHAEFNPGLGCVVNNREHAKEICKRKDLVEIGNDFGTGEKAVDHYDKQRAEKRAKAWEDI